MAEDAPLSQELFDRVDRARRYGYHAAKMATYSDDVYWFIKTPSGDIVGTAMNSTAITPQEAWRAHIDEIDVLIARGV